jgi:hypothetical protein
MRSVRLNYASGLLVTGLLFAVSLHAATVSHLGNEIDFGEGWRSTDVAKSNTALDPNGDAAWGSDGYFVALANPNVASNFPGYISNVTHSTTHPGISPQEDVNSIPVDDPRETIGPSVANLQPVFFANHSGQFSLFTITLGADADFVLTVIYDNQNPGLGTQYDVHAIEVTGPSNSDNVTGLTANNTPDYAFFRIIGIAGDVFTVKTTSDSTGTVVAGLGFEAVAAGAYPPVTGNLLIALDGSDVTTNVSGNVTSWNDQSGLGGAEDFTTGDAPTLTAEVMPIGATHNVVDFNGSADFLELGADSDMDLNTISWFIVTRSDIMPPSAPEVFLRSAYSSGAANAAGNNTLWGNFTLTAGKFVSHVRRANNSFNVDGPVAAGGQWVLLGGVWNGTGSTLNGNGAEEILIRAFDDGGANTYSVTDTGHDATPSGHIRTRIGKDSDGTGRHYDGSIAEILVYNTALSAADRTLVENHLINKYFVAAVSSGVVGSVVILR